MSPARTVTGSGRQTRGLQVRMAGMVVARHRTSLFVIGLHSGSASVQTAGTP